MKKSILSFIIFCLFFACGYGRNQAVSTVRTMIEQTLGSKSGQIILKTIPKENGCDVFEQSIKNGQLVIKGSSGVALSHGFYDFLRNNNLGIISWTGKRIAWPASLVGLKTHRMVSPVKHHYYFNVVTYGYSMPYWNWNRWKQEIDWMAFHGIDMPLALVANEAITARVWKKLGLTDEEINAYMVGPAHFPWMRMGNISGLDSPLLQNWYNPQVALQHKILHYMKALGMTPICPGFAGFVPRAINRIYPEVKLIETSWSTFHNWMLPSQDPLFIRIGKMFIQEWEKEFGKCDYYLADSFNEMDIPFPAKGCPERYTLLASYGDKVYQAIKAGNPRATWVMQGWMFGSQRNIWDYESLQALVSKVPDDKMLLLDLAADYNAHFWKNTFNWEFYKGFYNKQWVYSVIPNMGGKTLFTGILDFYANGHLQALNSPNRGQLYAIGMAPEGIENNEVIYELLTDVAWKNTHTDINEWLKNYSLSRYGIYNAALESYWNGLLKSVYGTFTDQPLIWQLRPGKNVKGSVCISEDYFKAVESFASCAKDMQGNKLYEADLKENMALYLGTKLELLNIQVLKATEAKDKVKLDSLSVPFISIMKGIDQLLETHPILNLNRWLDFARRNGTTMAEKDYYEKNARRIVTVWGTPEGDYSARVWSGLIRDYYLPRWAAFFKQMKNGKNYDISSQELNWVEKQKGVSPSVALKEPLYKTVQYWIEKTKDIK